MISVMVETHTRNLANALAAALATQISDEQALAERSPDITSIRNNRQRTNRLRQLRNRIGDQTRVAAVVRNWRPGSYVVSFSPRLFTTPPAS